MHEVQLLLVVVFAIAGHQEARRFGRQTGRTPWGWSPWAWAIVLGLSFLIGIILIAIAERQGRAQARHSAPVAPTNYQPPLNYQAPSPGGVYYPDSANFPPPPPIGEYAGSTILPNP